MNAFIFKHIRAIEMVGVLMRISSFSLVSWLGPESPFMFVWIFNTIDAVMLAWCSILRRDTAYSVLNLFWVLIGIVGILRASDILPHPTPSPATTSLTRPDARATPAQ